MPPLHKPHGRGLSFLPRRQFYPTTAGYDSDFLGKLFGLLHNSFQQSELEGHIAIHPEVISAPGSLSEGKADIGTAPTVYEDDFQFVLGIARNAAG